MSTYLNKLVYLTQYQYDSLINNGSIVVNGVTQTYDPNALYITEQDDIGELGYKDGLAWNEITQSGADSLTAGTSDITASTEILTSYASNNGFADTSGKGIVYRRAASKVVNATLVKTALSATATSSGHSNQFLRKDGTWQAPPYPVTSVNGATGAVTVGTVTSVQVQASSPLVSSSSAAQTGTLNTTISFEKVTANYVLAGTASGSTTYTPTFRALVASDIPSISITDQTTGTLPVTRGGTGITTMTTTNSVVIANSTTANGTLQTIASANGAFYATAANAKPQFGILPIAQGGTGKSSASDAWTALGGGASGKHADSYFVKAVTSTDNAITRFDSTAGQVQNSGVTIDDSNNIDNVNQLKITNTAANVHLQFSRTGGHSAPNYINLPANSSLAVSINGAGGSNIIAMVDPEGIVPYTTNTKSIGTSTYKWNAMYATTFYGALSGNADSSTQIKAALDATHKTYLLGTQTTITSTSANVNLTGDTGVYLNTTTGSLSAKYYQVNDGTNEKVTLQWNSTDLSLDFVFA